VIDLPVDIDTDKVTATLKNGILELTMPKTSKGAKDPAQELPKLRLIVAFLLQIAELGRPGRFHCEGSSCSSQFPRLQRCSHYERY